MANRLASAITGYNDIFKKYGLTSQVPADLQIAVRKEKKPIVRGTYQISFVNQPNTITKENIPVLQLLDCLRFKTILDISHEQACQRLIEIFSELDNKTITCSKEIGIEV